MKSLSLVVLIIGVTATGAAAAPGDQGAAPAPPPIQRPTPDFLFGEPNGSVGIRGSWVFARAGSDLFDFVRDRLTVDEGAFDAPAVGTDLAIAITPRLDAVFGVDFSHASVASEYRNFVDNNRQPIEQTTRLREVNLGGTLRVALTPRGIGVSRLAWIPSRVTPYVGAGGGFLWYEFTQRGDFVDEALPARPVFSDLLTSKGWTPSAHALGGVDVRIHRRTYVTLEGRYLWANAALQPRFERFEPIDLAGFRVSAGVNMLF